MVETWEQHEREREKNEAIKFVDKFDVFKNAKKKDFNPTWGQINEVTAVLTHFMNNEINIGEVKNILSSNKWFQYATGKTEIEIIQDLKKSGWMSEDGRRLDKGMRI